MFSTSLSRALYLVLPIRSLTRPPVSVSNCEGTKALFAIRQLSCQNTHTESSKAGKAGATKLRKAMSKIRITSLLNRKREKKMKEEEEAWDITKWYVQCRTVSY
jgi:hypothetical protein